MTDKIVATGWAVQWNDVVTVDSRPLANEGRVWRMVLGRTSTDDEITEAKRRGARAFRVRVVKMEDEE